MLGIEIPVSETFTEAGNVYTDYFTIKIQQIEISNIKL